MRGNAVNYDLFLQQKRLIAAPVGFKVDANDLNQHLFPFQRALVQWALQRGRAALFLPMGFGKTIQQLVWAEQVCQQTDQPVLILAPLAVATQTQREGQRFGIDVTVCRGADDVQPGVNIANYEMLHHFDASVFGGVVLDESSILKSYSGKYRTLIIEQFAATLYKLACTATPAPNDFMELGNHSEFLGIMDRTEMLAMFFTHDGGDTSKWRLKGHAESEFWKWLASWSVMIRKPSDIGFSDEGYILPPNRMHQHTVHPDAPEHLHTLFPMEAQTLTERRNARRASLDLRVTKAAEIANSTRDAVMVWCDLNDEGDALEVAIEGAVQISGSDSPEFKEQAMLDFIDGRIRVLVSKPSICGFGMNFQHCHTQIFVGLSDSFEQVYQATGRLHRFGQQHPVDTHIITADTEGAVVANIRRKQQDADRMADAMVAHVKDAIRANLGMARRDATEYRPTIRMIVPPWLRSETYDHAA
jgi:superfamily II DNA or RNA helicase